MRDLSSAVERLPDTQDVASSNLADRTTNTSKAAASLVSPTGRASDSPVGRRFSERDTTSGGAGAPADACQRGVGDAKRRSM